MKLSLLLLSAIGVLLIAVPAGATTYLVNPDGSGDYPTIQAAFQAEEVVDGDVIELGDGVFAGSGNREIFFRGKAVTVRSLSDDPKTCIIDCEQEARAFMFAYGEGPSSILEAVTITNGVASSGGAIYITSSSPTLRRCVFSGNHATDDGGAIRT